MPVRPATAADLPIYLTLYMEHLKEEAEAFPKCPVTDGPANQDRYRRRFLAYVGGWEDGYVGLWSPDPRGEPQGFLIVGHDGDQMVLRWEKPAWIEAIYVRPHQRGSAAMLLLTRAARQPLLDLGFTDCIGCVTVGNEVAFKMNTLLGGEPYAVMMERKL